MNQSKSFLSVCHHYCFKNGPFSASFLIYFWSFSSKHTNCMHQYNVKKCPSSSQCWDSNPQPLERESPLITTRPGLRARAQHCCFYLTLTFELHRSFVSDKVNFALLFWQFNFWLLTTWARMNIFQFWISILRKGPFPKLKECMCVCERREREREAVRTRNFSRFYWISVNFWNMRSLG